MLEKSAAKDKCNAVVMIQSFRAIHKIISDGNLYKDLNTRRKEYIRNFYREFFGLAKKLEIDYSHGFIKELCELNSKLNLWYPELEESIETVIDEFDLRYESFKNDKSLKKGM